MSKKLVQINVVCNGSTGRIMSQIQQEAINQGWEAYSFYGRGKPANDKCYKIGNRFDVLFHVLITRLFGKHGHASKRATKKLIKQIEQINPDVIHLHNVHGYYLHIETLFNYLKNSGKKIVWTLHDFWPITGHCTHFTCPKCNKWKTGCNDCIRKRDYPKSFILDNSKKEYLFKKELFSGISDMTLVAPSKWVEQHIKQSFMNQYETRVINNGIDLDIFKPTSTIDIRQKYNIPSGKKIVLGVSAVWSENKGLNEFYNLAERLIDDYIIVLVGLTKKQIKNLPNNIVGIERTESLEDLANFYTVADVLFNPSKEETFSLVTAEAIACGTQGIVYDNSAVKEVVENVQNGIILKYSDKLEDNIEKINEYLKKGISKVESCKVYDVNKMIKEYIETYE